MTVQGAIRELRHELSLSQEMFAHRLMSTTVRTIVRWEKGQPPHGQRLMQLARMAADYARDDLAAVFVKAFEKEFGVQIADIINGHKG